MKRTFTALTPESLALIGILDETYDFYMSISTQWADLISDWKEECILRAKEQKRFDSFCECYLCKGSLPVVPYETRQKFERKQVRRTADFIQSHIGIFSDECTKFHLCREAAVGFAPITVKTCCIASRAGYVTQRITFSSFVKWLEILVWRQFCIWKRKEFPHLSCEAIETAVFSILESRINELTNQRRRERICHDERIATEHSLLSEPLYVFKSLSNISCNLKKHTVAPNTQEIYSISESTYIVVPIHVCMDCHRRFIGHETLKQFSKSYGKLFVHTQDDLSNYDGSVFNCFSNESKLHALGYNVIDGEMNENDRHELLKYLISTEQISYFEACRDIERAIQLFNSSKKHQLAIQKWTNDLKFIGEYIIG
mgnify:FL=1